MSSFKVLQDPSIFPSQIPKLGRSASSGGLKRERRCRGAKMYSTTNRTCFFHGCCFIGTFYSLTLPRNHTGANHFDRRSNSVEPDFMRFWLTKANSIRDRSKQLAPRSCQWKVAWNPGKWEALLNGYSGLVEPWDHDIRKASKKVNPPMALVDPEPTPQTHALHVTKGPRRTSQKRLKHHAKPSWQKTTHWESTEFVNNRLGIVGSLFCSWRFCNKSSKGQTGGFENWGIQRKQKSTEVHLQLVWCFFLVEFMIGLVKRLLVLCLLLLCSGLKGSSTMHALIGINSPLGSLNALTWQPIARHQAS